MLATRRIEITAAIDVSICRDGALRKKAQVFFRERASIVYYRIRHREGEFVRDAIFASGERLHVECACILNYFHDGSGTNKSK